MPNPLTAEDKRNLDAALKDLKDVKDIIARAKRAGMDVSAQEAEAERQESALLGIKRQFFPGGANT